MPASKPQLQPFRILICSRCLGQPQPMARSCSCCRGSRQLVVHAPTLGARMTLQRRLIRKSNLETRLIRRQRWDAAGDQVFSTVTRRKRRRQRQARMNLGRCKKIGVH